VVCYDIHRTRGLTRGRTRHGDIGNVRTINRPCAISYRADLARRLLKHRDTIDFPVNEGAGNTKEPFAEIENVGELLSRITTVPPLRPETVPPIVKVCGTHLPWQDFTH
jgi:hypothetical protein